MPLDPTPNPSTPATPVAPVAPPPPAGSPPPPAPDQKPGEHPSTVTIPLETLTAFTAMQARLARVEAENQAREQQAQQEQAAILAKKGDVEAALDLLRKESDRTLAAARADLTMATDRAKRYAVDGELSRALASQPLVPGAAAQLTKLWRSEFASEPQGDSFQVRTPTFQSVGDFVAAQLASPEYAHFVRAQNPSGGTGGVSPATQTAPTQAAMAAAPEQPKTLTDAVILHMRDLQSKRGGGAGVDPIMDMGASIGLRTPSPRMKQA